MSFAEAQARVDAWISQYEEGYFDPLTNMTRLSEEVGELAREVNHRFGQKTKKKDEADGDMAMEMADIMFVLICMANREGIDLQESFDRMMAKVEGRDANRWTRQALGPAHQVREQEAGVREEDARIGPRQVRERGRSRASRAMARVPSPRCSAPGPAGRGRR